MDTIEKYLPFYRNKNIRIFYLLNILNNGGWLAVGSAIFYWTKFMSLGQMGVVQGVAFGIGLILNIPTGVLADIIGKKKKKKKHLSLPYCVTF